MQVTVLGKSPSWQDTGGACSGYLVEEGGCRLVIDCGNGVFGKLRAACDYHDVGAVLITHMHADHFLDLVPFSYARLYGPRAREEIPRLLLPPGGTALLRRIVGCWGSEDLVERAFDVGEYDPAGDVQLGDLRVRFCEVPHYVRAFAVEVTVGGATAGPRRFVFGADSAPNAELPEFARDADMLMLEATLTQPEEEPDRGHMTALQAGELARAAGARRLVITHFSDETDTARARADATAAYGAPVELATEGAVFGV